ncbi:MAG: twin-arginine translocase subunit TatC [Thermoguttaceae bacterium]|nr:twin-arginine translocase subunit TatC [Thermoguttaceae bacterium]
MAGKRRDDLFDDSSMSFGEHLDELRYRLIMSIYWLVGGFIIALIPGSWIIPGSNLPSLSGWAVSFIQRPLTRSLHSYYVGRSSDRIKGQMKRLEEMGYSPDIALIPARSGMADREVWLFPDDIARLRRILFPDQADSADPPAGPASVFTNEQLLAMADNYQKPDTEAPGAGELATPSSQGAVSFIFWEKLADDPRVKAKSLSMPETFVIFLKAAVFLGILIGSPGIFYHFWAFVGAGLYASEKRYVYKYLPFSLTLFFAGAALAFFVIFEMVLSFLLTFNAGMNIDPDPRISEWLKFAMILPLGFGISFQLPLVMFALYRLRIFTIEAYWDKWRISVVIIAFLSMMFTPPDPWSMICMVSALISLYFLGILLCKLAPVPKLEDDDDDDDR